MTHSFPTLRASDLVDQVMCSARLVFRKKRRVPLSGSDSDAIRPWTNWMRRRPKSMRRRTGNRDAKMTKVTFISADGQNRMVVDAQAGENLLDIARWKSTRLNSSH